MANGKHIAPKTRTGRVSWGIVGLVFGLFLAMSFPAGAGGSVDKATGEGTWVNQYSTTMTASFNAHEKADDNRPAKGWLEQTNYNSNGVAAGYFAADITYVEIDPLTGKACFGGVVVEATGTRDGKMGEPILAAVGDGGSGFDETGMDYYRAGFVTPSATNCASLFANLTNNDPWSGGNVQIHAAKGHTD